MAEMDKEELYRLLSQIGGRSASSQVSPTVTPSNTITSREVDYGDKGGGGGMGMASAFVDLGDKLHKNALSTIGLFSGLEDRQRERNRQTMLDSEAKRQFNENLKLGKRDRNMAGMEILANIRGEAGQRARQRSPFREALGRSVR